MEPAEESPPTANESWSNPLVAENVTAADVIESFTLDDARPQSSPLTADSAASPRVNPLTAERTVPDTSPLASSDQAGVDWGVASPAASSWAAPRPDGFPRVSNDPYAIQRDSYPADAYPPRASYAPSPYSSPPPVPAQPAQQYENYEPPAPRYYPQHPGVQRYPVPSPYAAYHPVAFAPNGFDPVTGLPLSSKSKVAAGLLQVFLGSLGIGRFYMGHVAIGIAQILLTFFTFGFGALWGFIDGFVILAGRPRDSNGMLLR